MAKFLTLTELNALPDVDVGGDGIQAGDDLASALSPGDEGILISPNEQVFTIPVPAPVYAEQGIVFDKSQSLLGPGKLSVDSTTALFFASFITPTSSRDMILSPNGSGWGFWNDYSGSPFADIQHDAGSYVLESTLQPALNDRVHMLVSFAPASATSFNLKMWIWDETTAAWTNVSGSQGRTGSSILWDTNGAANYKIGGRTGDTAMNLEATVFRIALWTEMTAVPDIDQAAVRDKFADGLSIVDPAISVTDFGAPKLDAVGDLATWQSGLFTYGGQHTVTGVLGAA